MQQNEYAGSGNLKISEDVIAAIAGTATSEIKGVAGLSPRPVTDVRGLIPKKGIGKSIKLAIKDGEAVIDVFVDIKIGAKIPETAEQVQTKVKDAVQNMTGITVNKVNVHVSGLVLPQPVNE